MLRISNQRPLDQKTDDLTTTLLWLYILIRNFTKNYFYFNFAKNLKYDNSKGGTKGNANAKPYKPVYRHSIEAILSISNGSY